MRVICINDTKLPPDAKIVEGKEYEVQEKFVNNYDQIVYIIKGVVNEGRTKFGLPWIGYLSTRFAILDSKELVEEKHEKISILN